MKVDAKTLAKIGIAVFLTYIAIYYWKNISGFVGALFTAIVPIVIGCAIAYVVNLVMSFYERIYFPKSQKKFVIKSRRPICLTAAVLSLIAVISLIIIIVIPQFTSCINLLLFEKLPETVESVVYSLESWEILPEDMLNSLIPKDWGALIGENIGLLTNGLTDIVGIAFKFVTSVVGGFITAFLSVIFSIYLLLSKETLISHAKSALKKFMKPDLYQKTEYVLGVANETFRGYIIGQSTDALILGVLCALGMWILGLPYYAMIGALIAFTALIPIAGGYIGGAIGAFMIFTVDPVQALIFVIYLVILQQIEGNLIYPKVVGNSVGLPAIWVLVAITVGGGILGVVGMLISVPVAAVIYKILAHKNSQAVTE